MTPSCPLTVENYDIAATFIPTTIVIRKVDVISAVALLKEKIGDKKRYNEGWRNLILQDIDSCFQIGVK